MVQHECKHQQLLLKNDIFDHLKTIKINFNKKYKIVPTKKTKNYLNIFT